jgi:hypothetical protein
MEVTLTRFTFAASSLIAIFALGGPALASPNTAAAEALFQDGKKLMSAGKYAEACPKLEESLRLDAATGTLLNLAACHEKMGKTATAWSEYSDAVAVARRSGQPDREKAAADRVKALQPALSMLTVTVPAAAQVPGLEIRVDGTALGKGSWGTAIPFDPGTHEVTATATGKRAWRTEVEVGPNGAKVSVSAPVLSDEAQPAAPTATAPATGAATTQDTGVKGGSTKTAGYVVGAIGIVSLGVGAYFGFDSLSKRKQSDDICGTGSATCTSQEGIDKEHQANTSAWISNVGIGVGLVGVGVGTYLLLRKDSSNSAAPSTGTVFTPVVGAGFGGFSLNGRW